MSSEKFENVEDDFVTIRTNLSTKINDILPKSSGQARKNLTRDILRGLDEAQHLLEELEGEARIAPYPYRLQMNTCIKTHHQELSSLKKRLSQNENSALANRNQLLGTTSTSNWSSDNPTIVTNRGRLLQMNDTLERTSNTLVNTQQIAAETDEVSVAVVDELGTQRESLLRTKERLIDTDVNLTRSRKILLSMYRRVMTNKLILIVIIIMELLILGGIVYYKFIRKAK